MALSSRLHALYVLVIFMFGSLTMFLHSDVRQITFQLFVPENFNNIGGETIVTETAVAVAAANDSVNDAAMTARSVISKGNKDKTGPNQNSTAIVTATTTASFDDFYNRCNATRKGEGVILLNFLGRMANNFFELAFARRLAKDLCWKILYRPGWDHELPSERGKQCLPNASLPDDYTQLPELDSETAQKLELTQELWARIVTNKNEYKKWIKRLKEDDQVMELKARHFEPERVIRTINQRNSRIRIINLRGFYIHYSWMEPHLNEIRQQLSLNPDCCYNTPPEDAVVFHVRDFGDPKNGGNIQYDKVYTQLIRHYNWSDRPIWVVCQPKTMNSPMVSAIRNATKSKSITVIPGKDQYDAFCTLTRSTTLVGSAASTYSQMAPLLSPDASTEFHFFLPRARSPRVTMHVPQWKYHLVSKNRMEIDTFDISHEKVTFSKVT